MQTTGANRIATENTAFVGRVRRSSACGAEVRRTPVRQQVGFARTTASMKLSMTAESVGSPISVKR